MRDLSERAGRLLGGLGRHAVALAIAGAILAWRFYQARGLVLPAWVDSVHHTLLVRVLLDQGRLPETWAPYLPQVPFYYHLGFHVTAAAVARIAGLDGVDLGRAVLIAGHGWQGVLSLGVYALGWAVWRDRTRALVGMVVAGFFCTMPAFYTAWGRYTLLAGAALMAWAMAAAVAGRPVALALLIGATSMTHEYAFALLLLFLAMLIVMAAAAGRRPVVLGSAAGLALALPWQVRVWTWGQQYVHLEAGQTGGGYSVGYLAQLLGPAHNLVVWVGALLGLALVVRRLVRDYQKSRSGEYALAGWTIVLVALLGPWSFGPFRADYTAIVLFLPGALLAAEALALALGAIGAARPRRALLAGAVLALAGWGAWQTSSVTRPEVQLAGAGDVAALRWVAEQTPPDALFLIDTAPWMWDWRGVDGGWWIMPLTGRRTVLPPTPYVWGPPESVTAIAAQAARAYQLARLSGAAYCRELGALLADSGAAYYYTHLLAPAACPSVRPVYSGGPNGPAIYQATD